MMMIKREILMLLCRVNRLKGMDKTRKTDPNIDQYCVFENLFHIKYLLYFVNLFCSYVIFYATPCSDSPVLFQHPMVILSSDGHDLQPVHADSVILNPGERFDFYINTNQTAAKYWIRVETFEVGPIICFCLLYKIPMFGQYVCSIRYFLRMNKVK